MRFLATGDVLAEPIIWPGDEGLSEPRTVKVRVLSAKQYRQVVAARTSDAQDDLWKPEALAALTMAVAEWPPGELAITPAAAVELLFRIERVQLLSEDDAKKSALPSPSAATAT